MATIKIHGASDDLVEVESEPRGVKGCDEYGFYAVGQTGYLSASDGSVIAIGYAIDDTGCWRVSREVEGRAAFAIAKKGDEDADNQDGVSGYSDLAILEGDISWVKWHGKNRAAAKRYAAQNLAGYWDVTVRDEDDEKVWSGRVIAAGSADAADKGCKEWDKKFGFTNYPRETATRFVEPESGNAPALSAPESSGLPE